MQYADLATCNLLLHAAVPIRSASAATCYAGYPKGGTRNGAENGCKCRGTLFTVPCLARYLVLKPVVKIEGHQSVHVTGWRYTASTEQALPMPSSCKLCPSTTHGAHLQQAPVGRARARRFEADLQARRGAVPKQQAAQHSHRDGDGPGIRRRHARGRRLGRHGYWHAGRRQDGANFTGRRARGNAIRGWRPAFQALWWCCAGRSAGRRAEVRGAGNRRGRVRYRRHRRRRYHTGWAAGCYCSWRARCI